MKKPNGEWNWDVLLNGERHIMKGLRLIDLKVFPANLYKATKARNVTASFRFDYSIGSYVVQAQPAQNSALK